MEFRTEIDIPKLNRLIAHNDPIMTIGSCFAKNLGSLLETYKFDVFNNPFGVLYNPASIAASLEILLIDKQWTRDDLIFYDGEWHSFYHHSNFSFHDPDIVIERITSQLETTKLFLQKSQFIIFTLGSAYVFRDIARGMIVSNCHKIPDHRFKRVLLGSGEVVFSINRIIEIVREFNPDIDIIFSVSPIRHLKDGLHLNQVSKSLLILALNEVISNSGNTHYFPAYEIMMDDLRDYRFYEANLTHPNAIAIEYIWEKFKSAALSDTCKETIGDIEKLNKALAHKVRNPLSGAHRNFLEKQIGFIKKLQIRYPYLDLEQEESFFRTQISENNNQLI